MQSLRPATILTKSVGHVIPKDFFEESLKDTTCIGYAVQDADDTSKEPFIFSEFGYSKASVDDLMELQETAKDKRVVFWLGRGELPQNCVQPFIFQVDNEDVMAIFIEGDLPGYHHDNGATDEKNVLDEIVLPNLARNMKFAGGDAEKFFAELNDDTFQKTLMGTAANRGVFCFLPLAGDLVACGNNPIGKEFEWGTSSQGTIDFDNMTGATAKAAEPAAAPPKRGGFLNRTKSAVTAAVAAVKSPQITTDKVGTHHIKEPVKDEKPVIAAQTAAAAEKTVSSKGKSIVIPTKFTNKEKQSFIRKHMKGDLPKGYKRMSTVLSMIDEPVAESMIVDKTLTAQVDAAAAASQQLRVVGGTTIKDAATPGTGDRVAAVKAAEVNMFTLDKNEKQAAEDFVIKHLDFNSKEIPSPEEIQKIEAKYGSFSKQVGFDVERLFRAPPDRLEELCKRNTKFAFLALLEMRRLAQNAMKTQGSGKVEDLVGTDVKEAVVAAAPSPARKGGFLSKRAG